MEQGIVAACFSIKRYALMAPAAGRIVYEGTVVDENPLDDDVEAAFKAWQGGFEDSETPGQIRAFKVPLDSDGRASHSAQNQIRLGNWPVDQYSFDELCNKLMRDYMDASEMTMAVRLIGTETGKSGVRFNKIVTLRRANQTPQTSTAKDSVAEILRAMQENNAAMMRAVAEMRGPNVTAQSTDNMQQMMQFAAMMRTMMEPMTTMFAAMMGRNPASSPGPSSDLKGLVETLVALDDLRGSRGGGDSGGDGTATIVKAVADVASPLLQMAAKAQPARRALPKPQMAPAPQPLPNPMTPPVATPPQAQAPAGIDLSRPSTVQVSPFAPGPDIQAPSNPIANQESQQMFAEMKKQVDALVEMARNGADPNAVGDLFFDQQMMLLDDENYAKLAGTIEGANFLNQISIYNTGVREQLAFFEALKKRIMERVHEADAEAGTDE